uniref:Uncharacterized protein n=1 Tax=Caenorhabditis japonica TaxID=281687 RepID=A0A8R1IXC7_CAEJA
MFSRFILHVLRCTPLESPYPLALCITAFLAFHLDSIPTDLNAFAPSRKMSALFLTIWKMTLASLSLILISNLICFWTGNASLDALTNLKCGFASTSHRSFQSTQPLVALYTSSLVHALLRRFSIT